MIAPIILNVGAASDADIVGALQAAEKAIVDRFFILERSGQYFCQALCTAAGWVVEKREGDEASHYRAHGKSNAPPPTDTILAKILSNNPPIRTLLEFDEAVALMIAFRDQLDDPPWVIWHQIWV